MKYLLATVFILLPINVFASVVINEIAWMGTEVSYNDEWVELYNNTGSSINFEGWILKAADGSPEINLSGIITAKSFYLLERTNDDTVPGITADYIYTGALKNEGENLELYDDFGNLIDSVNCSSGWFAGDNSTKQTMERKNPLLISNLDNWQTSQNPGGTPKTENSIAAEPEDFPEEPVIGSEPEPESALDSQPTEKLVEVEPRQIYPSGVVISEILPSPTGPDSEEEWIEVFNQNNFEVNLSGWQIADTVGKTNIYTFPEGTTISLQGFLVLPRPTTKITLNNSGDDLKLIQPDGNVINVVNYEKAPRGESFNRTKSGWAWSASLTPGSANIIPTRASLLEEERKETKKEPPTSSSPLPIAMTIAFFSGAIILILKNKVKKGYNKNV